MGASSDTWGAKWNTNADDEDALLGAIITTGSADAYILTTSLSLAAYVAGQTFWIKANFTNSGAATIAVDGLAAKAIRKNGATALAAGDITSGNIYAISYDASNGWFQLVAGGGFQTLDATLTALAALSWSSGNALVQFTAADTVSLTLTPSVSSVTASQGAANTTPSATLTNTTDNAAVRVVRYDGDRATPTINDRQYSSYFMSDANGVQVEIARIAKLITTITNGSHAGQIRWSVASAGSLVEQIFLQNALLGPTSNDGVSLGASALAFSDLFLASGAVINFADGGVTMTHDASRDMIDVAAGSFRAKAPAASQTTGTAAAADANSVFTCTGDVTLDDDIFASRDVILFDPGTSARTFTRSAGLAMYVNGTDSASAILAANQMGTVYWRDTDTAILSGAFT